jgi:hypothetical protein
MPAPPPIGTSEPSSASQVGGASAEVSRVFDQSGASFGGFGEILVRIRNVDPKTLKGEVRIASTGWRRDHTVVAPFVVSSGATAAIHLPVDIQETVKIEVVAEDGRSIASREMMGGYDVAVRLVDLYDPPRSRAVIDGLPLTPDYQPSAHSGRWSSNEARLRVASASIDPTTGSPIMPRHGVGYQGSHLVLAPSELVTRLDGAELEALASFVVGGGILALGVSKPEDLRHPTIVAMLGGEAEATPAGDLQRQLLPWPARPGVTAPYGSRALPTPAPPREAVKLSGFRGGNLRASHFGATASYGLGEVVLLSFDPRNPAQLEDGFVQIRLAELARRAFDKQGMVVAPLGRTADPNFAFYGGPFSSFDPYDGIRKQLDPNRTARWGIGIATILICLYAVLAGPVLFNGAKKRNRPLAALRWLPVASLVTFLAVVVIGVFAKGLGRRVHHLALVDAGAGMTHGVIRRYRGFFGPDADALTVRVTEQTSAISIAGQLERPTRFVVERDGVRLSELETMPAETVVVREDGLAKLGDGVSILPDGADDFVIQNRTGRPLRTVVARTPTGRFFWAPALADGERVSTSAMQKGGVEFGDWQRSIVSRSAGAIMIRDLGPHQIAKAFDEMGERDLGEAWKAIAQSSGEDANWWPDDVPSLIAQVDGGEGRTNDGGMPVHRARLLIRVVGWGGEP